MQITFVTDTYPPDVNGAAKTLFNIVHNLRNMGHEVTLVGPHPESELNIISMRVPKYASVSIGLIRKSRLLAHWQRNCPDVVYIAGEAFLGKAAIKAAAELGIPTIAGYHTNFAQYAANWRMKFLVKRTERYLLNFHRKVSATVAPSDTTKENLLGQGYPNLHVLGRGVDSKLFNPNKRSDELRSSWGAGPADPVAIFVSRISPEKNLDLLSRAFKQLVQAKPATRCVVVGDGPSQERFARENPDCIHYKFTHGEKLAEICASADISIFPSMTETFGNTVTEALASGLVVVAFDYAAAQMHIEHQVNGLLVNYGDEAQFLETCNEALDYVQDSNFRERARSSVSDLTWDSIAEKFIEIAVTLQPEKPASMSN